ncbi:glucuronate isomerase [Afifella sp. IM 167]|uniref:glucuronate isomerase n=1 Tax=Afifella sp. IM 167 TaxID=2033586 RepID=UPI001CCB7090|nr:glucuronate isomerase [Afifella sp. IM 167]MBZ8134267.1 glucuronate isomerase [Afifella sp. IM 167]
MKAADRLHPDRLFASEPEQRRIARALYEEVAELPIISPHGHCDPRWFAENERFPDPAELLIVPDHYVFRMLYSKGVSLDALGIPRRDGTRESIDPRRVWQIFADHWYLFLGTPTRLWMDYVLVEVLGICEELTPESAPAIYDAIESRLAEPGFRPRALYERFGLEALATTDSASDSLEHHRAIADSGWKGRILPTFRPDAVTDAAKPGFAEEVEKLGAVSGESVDTFDGYLRALHHRRQFFRSMGATATDHGAESPTVLDLGHQEAAALYDKALRKRITPQEAAAFSAHMLFEMARMSVEDGLVMQLHAGSLRDRNRPLFEAYGPNAGADIPQAVSFVHGLKPLLDAFGNEPRFTLILFTLDETTYARELAPLAGHYPSLLLGPPWWFHDSPEGILRYRHTVTETAGFFNTAGFNDDTRAFLSIPARHDLSRRMDCRFLAELVAEHRLTMAEARMLARELSHGLAKRAYRL